MVQNIHWSMILDLGMYYNSFKSSLEAWGHLTRLEKLSTYLSDLYKNY